MPLLFMAEFPAGFTWDSTGRSVLRKGQQIYLLTDGKKPVLGGGIL